MNLQTKYWTALFKQEYSAHDEGVRIVSSQTAGRAEGRQHSMLEVGNPGHTYPVHPQDGEIIVLSGSFLNRTGYLQASEVDASGCAQVTWEEARAMRLFGLWLLARVPAGGWVVVRPDGRWPHLDGTPPYTSRERLAAAGQWVYSTFPAIKEHVS